MDFSFSELNFNSVETLRGFEARAAFTINSATVFRENIDIMPTIVDNTISSVLWGDEREKWQIHIMHISAISVLLISVFGFFLVVIVPRQIGR